MNKILLLIMVFVSTLEVLPAQVADSSTDPWYMGKPIEAVNFEGLNHINIADLKGITSQFIGKPYSPGVFKDLQSKLFALDFFRKFNADAEPVNSERNAVIIIFTVEERPLIDEIVIEGNKKIRKGDILDAILLKKEDIFSTTKMKKDEESIEEFYYSKGYPDVSVETEISELEDNLVKVIFSVEEGNQTRLREIFFSGNKVFSDSTLKDKLSIKVQSLLNNGVFQENELKINKLALETYYYDHGYIDARVVEIEQEIVESENGRNYMTLTFYFSEGKEWTFGELIINGNELFSNNDILGLITHKSGD